jgi:hypothetical protein
LDDLEFRITFKIIDETVHRIPRRNLMGYRAAVPLELDLVAIGRHLESFNFDEARW